jgi:putative ABC transport system substrate-binding protein
MQTLGWHRGSNIQFDIRWVDRLDRLAELAKQLVASRPDLIHVYTTVATAAVLRETRDIPVLFSVVLDPVAAGLVTNLARPGGNVTGFSLFDTSLAGKLIELLKELAPQTSRVMMLFNPDTAGSYINKYWELFEPASTSFGLSSKQAPYRNSGDLEQVIGALGPTTGLVAVPDISNQIHHRTIIALAARQSVPSLYGFRFFVEDGGLASYGVDIVDEERVVATYADRILKGEHPADLPIQLPTHFELTINLATAKALGLNISAALAARADQLIQ